SDHRELNWLQICVRRRVPENPQHRYDLAFVMKCVSYDVQQDKRRTPQFSAPIHWTPYESGVQLTFGEATYIVSGRFLYSALLTFQRGQRGAIFAAPKGKSPVL